MAARVTDRGAGVDPSSLVIVQQARARRRRGVRPHVWPALFPIPRRPRSGPAARTGLRHRTSRRRRTSTRPARTSCRTPASNRSASGSSKAGAYGSPTPRSCAWGCRGRELGRPASARCGSTTGSAASRPCAVAWLACTRRRGGPGALRPAGMPCAQSCSTGRGDASVQRVPGLRALGPSRKRSRSSLAERLEPVPPTVDEREVAGLVHRERASGWKKRLWRRISSLTASKRQRRATRSHRSGKSSFPCASSSDLACRGELALVLGRLLGDLAQAAHAQAGRPGRRCRSRRSAGSSSPGSAADRRAGCPRGRGRWRRRSSVTRSSSIRLPPHCPRIRSRSRLSTRAICRAGRLSRVARSRDNRRLERHRRRYRALAHAAAAPGPPRAARSGRRGRGDGR